MTGNREELLFALGQAAVDAVKAVEARSKAQEEPADAFPSTQDPAFGADDHCPDALAHSISATLSPLFEAALQNDILPTQRFTPPRDDNAPDAAHQSADKPIHWEEEFRLPEEDGQIFKKNYLPPGEAFQSPEMPHQSVDKPTHWENEFRFSEEDHVLEEDYSAIEEDFPIFETPPQDADKPKDADKPIQWEKEFRLLEEDYQAIEEDYQVLEEDYKTLAENYQVLEEDYRSLDEKVVNLESQLAQAIDRAQKQEEDLESYRKRVVRDQEKERCQREAKLALDFIVIMDNFERAIAHAKQCSEFGTLLQGIELMGKMYLSKLAKYGCVPFDSLGAIFDPHQHDVLSRVVDEEAPHNVIVQEHLRGYIMHDRVLRPALVVVSQNAHGDEDVIGD
ncbi:MAG: nucleotide exchange factor GrpE [Proteobacteria bacterium]|nr:nucleotide exchange factor GrpE [Pseudomonadota bacterium]